MDTGPNGRKEEVGFHSKKGRNLPARGLVWGSNHFDVWERELFLFYKPKSYLSLIVAELLFPPKKTPTLLFTLTGFLLNLLKML
jgi:hypothetical protein